jgi:Lipase (class 3)
MGSAADRKSKLASRDAQWWREARKRYDQANKEIHAERNELPDGSMKVFPERCLVPDGAKPAGGPGSEAWCDERAKLLELSPEQRKVAPPSNPEAMPSKQGSPKPASTLSSSWTVANEIGTTVSGPYESETYRIRKALVMGYLSSVIYDSIDDDAGKAAFENKLRTDPVLKEHGFKVAYWIDDTHQQNLCVDESIVGKNKKLAEWCEAKSSSILPARDTQAALLSDVDGNLYGLARGTESFLDAVTDALFLWRDEWAGGLVHPGFKHAWDSISPYWPIIQEFLKSRKVAPETLEQAVAVEFSPGAARKLSVGDLLPKHSSVFQEYEALTLPQKALLYAQHRLGKMDAKAIAKRYGLHDSTAEQAIQFGERVFLRSSHLSREEQGFKKALQKMTRSTLGISLGGHSLGGAIVTIAARDANMNDILVKDVYTVGSPRVFDDAGAAAYDAAPNGEQALADSTYRQVADLDIVAHLAPIGWGYKHVAQKNERQFRTNSDGTYKVRIGMTRAEKIAWFWKNFGDDALGDTTRDMLKSALGNHSVLTSYLETMNGVLNQELEQVRAEIERQVGAKVPGAKKAVLELVDGTSPLKLMDGTKLVTREDLELFVKDLEVKARAAKAALKGR